ncbi:MAG: Asp-tRNA(Asn)/Glu-tRNA(Gln) amidotransferase subunit GatB [Pirellulaceae bacterium]|jgi:aspartyl-tRNA(Asn)/glutamyl-tRNA(Gln) amidotransferase subunit B|nr:Asp-tRNA(Asn)/Glu-tRNA(Gln) amidotransferase subunit GatB [Pirellulaceae bacterium]
MSAAAFTTVIGLEVHVQLKTRTKLFCRCSTQFGAPPNTQTCEVCLGLPGSLPVMNRRAVELALRAAVALHCDIPTLTKWDRKNYYYPDLPKGYQISQYDLPLSRDGYLDLPDPQGAGTPRRVRILRAHLEEDAGKSMHDEVAGHADSRIDLNRAGTPLLEIVTQPDLRSPTEARFFLNELKLLLSYLDVSDCNMQEGSLRVDANVNLHLDTPRGRVATPIVEIKNMNSFRAVERALAYEAQRQGDEWRTTGRTLGEVPKQTRGWDDQAQVTRGQRHKEESSDYRYFPEPDLVPVTVRPEEVAAVRAALTALPATRRAQLVAHHGLDPYDADVLVNQGPALVDYFEQTVACGADARRASNWLQQDVLRTLNERGLTIQQLPVPAAGLAELLRSVAAGELETTRARQVFQRMVETGATVAAARQALGIVQVASEDLLELCRTLLAEHPHIVRDVRGGKTQALGALIGKARQRNPNVDPARVKAICSELIAAADTP